MEIRKFNHLLVQPYGAATPSVLDFDFQSRSIRQLSSSGERSYPASMVDGQAIEVDIEASAQPRADGRHSVIQTSWDPVEGGPTDPVVDALNAVLQFVGARTELPCAQFIDSVRQAIHAHVTHKNGPREGMSAERRQRLTAWQERRAKEYLAMHASDAVSIAGAAAVCKLSLGYFIRAFKSTTGQTPHRWLTVHRIKMAKELLLGPLSIAEIASTCGFSDQSHLTRAFVKLVGSPPGAWRRENRDDVPKVAASNLSEVDLPRGRQFHGYGHIGEHRVPN